MADDGKVVINLATGMEDAERVTVAFLVGGAAVEKGKQVAMFLTKEAVRLGLPGYAEATACDGCPPLSRLFQQYIDGGGELLVCPICCTAGQRTSTTRPSSRTCRSPPWSRLRGSPIPGSSAGSTRASASSISAAAPVPTRSSPHRWWASGET